MCHRAREQDASSAAAFAPANGKVPRLAVDVVSPVFAYVRADTLASTSLGAVLPWPTADTISGKLHNADEEGAFASSQQDATALLRVRVDPA